MTEKRQTSQGYIIRILQHFATKIFVQTCLDQNFTQKGKGLLIQGFIIYTDDLVILFYKHAFEVFEGRRIGISIESRG
jgi:hypothetical protein